ncbi:PucR family transcriptional regulator [Nocardioides zeae]|uniref:PucR family transcriptional regulator n=1 Tax=Nocardioides zeae TaxID=1457234 RepID=A0A6P0HIF0_9ACTN|nr:helix-turn-helix domain-containing protein [Nocardioides zeae]NEN78060.1 PucR family transcriptional regulator [Nocardioides zeae]
MVQENRVAALVDALSRDEQLVEPVVRRVRSEITSYALVPTEQLVVSLGRNRERALRTLREGAVPVEDEIWEAERTTLERLAAGLPIEDIMSGFRISIAAIQDRLAETAEELGVELAEIVRLTRLLWRLSDVFAAQAAKAYRAHAVASAVAEQRVRDTWVSAVLTGSGLDDDALDRARAGLGLAPDASYVAFSAKPVDELSAADAQARIAERLSGQLCLVIPGEERLAGILEAVPADVDGLVLGVGPAVTPDRLAESFELAQRILDTAGAEVPGTYTVGRLGWRLSVRHDPWLGEHLRSTYVEPLETARGHSGPILDALRAYLENERNLASAAAVLHVHVNTVRYRLARFEQLTGRSLASTDTLVDLAHTLHALELGVL